MDETYDPQPIETSGVELPAELRDLVERLAESNHDHWARRRIREGWRYGPQRDEGVKSHPDLVPYHLLVDEEKEYDRTSVIETIKAIIALGYEVRRQRG